ncbi:MAG: co-chaperone GroES [Candidatus Woesearchaeota archaeon]
MIKPIGERVLIKPIKKETRTAAGIYLPETDEKQQEGIVEAIGVDKEGKPLPLQKGVRIIYGGYSNQEFTYNNQQYIIVDYKDVLAEVKQ